MQWYQLVLARQALQGLKYGRGTEREEQAVAFLTACSAGALILKSYDADKPAGKMLLEHCNTGPAAFQAEILHRFLGGDPDPVLLKSNRCSTYGSHCSLFP